MEDIGAALVDLGCRFRGLGESLWGTEVLGCSLAFYGDVASAASARSVGSEQAVGSPRLKARMQLRPVAC